MKIHDVHIQVPAPPKQDEQGQQDRPPSDTIKILVSDAHNIFELLVATPHLSGLTALVVSFF